MAHAPGVSKVFDTRWAFNVHNHLQTNATTPGEKIKQDRIQNGFSLRRLAKVLGVDPGRLARWEGSRSKPKTAFKLRLDEIFNRGN